MKNANTVKVALFFIDREGNVSQMTLHLPFSTPANSARNFALAALSLTSSISDAVPYGYKLTWSFREEEPDTPASTSDVRRLGALFYRNEDYYEAVWIPSAREELTEEQGLLKGVRFDENDTAYQNARDALTSALQATVTPEGDPWPDTYTSGGIAL